MIFLAFAVLLSQVPFYAQTGTNGNQKWEPYNFKGTEYFKYEVTGIEDGKKKKGYEIIDIKKEGSKYKIKIEGKYGESEGSFTTTVQDKDQIPSAIITQGMFNPYLAPLAIGLFSPAWVFYFTFGGMAMEVGSKWKSKDEEGNVVEVEIPGYESYAGKKGKKLVVRENGKEVYVIVWAEDVALPLYLKMKKESEDVYEFKLVEYKE